MPRLTAHDPRQVETLLASHLAVTELSTLPAWYLRHGVHANQYVTPAGRLFTCVQRDGAAAQWAHIAPRRTPLRERLKTDDAQFAAFVAELLRLDYHERPAAAAALEHPWLQIADDSNEVWPELRHHAKSTPDIRQTAKAGLAAAAPHGTKGLGSVSEFRRRTSGGKPAGSSRLALPATFPGSPLLAGTSAAAQAPTNLTEPQLPPPPNSHPGGVGGSDAAAAAAAGSAADGVPRQLSDEQAAAFAELTLSHEGDVGDDDAGGAAGSSMRSISPTLPGPSTPLQFREQLFREPTRSHALAAPHEFGADLPPDGSPGSADPGVGRLWAKRGVSHVGSNADSAATSAAGSLAGSQYNSPGCGRSA